MPADSSTSFRDQVPSRSPESDDRNKSPLRWIPVLVAIALVVTPVAYYGLESEVVQWRIAAAKEAYLNVSADAGIESISVMIQDHPDNAEALALRSQWLQEAGRLDGALHDSEKVMQLLEAETDSNQIRLLAWSLNHAALLSRMRRISAAKTQLDQIVQELGKELTDPGVRTGSIETLRNNIAYHYSQISQRHTESEELIDLACRDYAPEAGNFAAIAQIYALGNHHEQSVAIHTKAIERIEDDYRLASMQLAESGTDALAYGVPIRNEHAGQLKSTLKDVQKIGESYQQLLKGRADSYRQLGMTDQEQNDRAAIKKLGEFSEPPRNPLESWLPESRNIRLNPRVIDRILTSSTFIDTRGCVRLRLGKYEQALEDFDYAIVAFDACEFAGEIGDNPRALHDLRMEATLEKHQREGRATMLYHRFLANQKLGRTQAAEEDRKAITDLGFEVGPSLF